MGLRDAVWGWGLGSVITVVVGLDDPEGLFQPEQFYNSTIGPLKLGVGVEQHGEWVQK